MAGGAGLQLLPGTGRNLIRFHFAKRPETLAAAGERLLSLREKAWSRKGNSKP